MLSHFRKLRLDSSDLAKPLVRFSPKHQLVAVDPVAALSELDAVNRGLH
jgi:hypothetical protein